ncbi:metal ABC transporter permease [uncultured Limosilactobacillus sp.]|uniref:metal ABC transporter permease n=1 Tax=uncultured Limosilactobacillus sp. TaxID=2837629 RepID=UPI002601453E|nr:metal ABC transporter permease [uncultured Limosilactobacillus sp.]
MFDLDFMRYAFIASTFIAITSGVMGVFIVARKMSFLTHTLSEIGFAGGSFAVFAGWPLLNGMLLFTLLSSILVGQLSTDSNRRESVTTAVSGLCFGMGILFLSLSNKMSNSATSILFGSIVGISSHEVTQLIILSILVVIMIGMIFKPLKFDSFDHIGASAAGIKINLVSTIFLLLLAISVSVAAQIVGSLLIFILLTLPAASAQYFTHRIDCIIILSTMFCLVGTYLGLVSAYITNWPVSFFVASFEVGIYFLALLFHKLGTVVQPSSK